MRREARRRHPRFYWGNTRHAAAPAAVGTMPPEAKGSAKLIRREYDGHMAHKEAYSMKDRDPRIQDIGERRLSATP